MNHPDNDLLICELQEKIAKLEKLNAVNAAHIRLLRDQNAVLTRIMNNLPPEPPYDPYAGSEMTGGKEGG